jgi:fructose transport system permease protein
MVFTSIVMASTFAQFGLPAPVALIVGLVIGTLAGGLNGLLVTRLRLPPFIVTLGTLNILIALTLLYSGGQTVQSQDLPDILLWTGQAIDIGSFRITVGVLLMLAMYAVAWFVLKNTAWGRHVYATGDDPEAARLAGIAVTRILLTVYLVAGFIYALSAWILIGRVGAASPNAAADANLDSITAVVIGGTSLFGGSGGVGGTLIGAGIVAAVNNLLNLLGVPPFSQRIAKGLIILGAVLLERRARGKEEGR